MPSHIVLPVAELWAIVTALSVCITVPYWRHYPPPFRICVCTFVNQFKVMTSFAVSHRANSFRIHNITPMIYCFEAHKDSCKSVVPRVKFSLRLKSTGSSSSTIIIFIIIIYTRPLRHSCKRNAVKLMISNYVFVSLQLVICRRI